MATFVRYNAAAGRDVEYREIPWRVAMGKPTLGAVRKRRASDYAAACRWRPLADRVAELEAEIRVLKGEPRWPALPSPAEWAARQARLDAEGDAPFVAQAEVAA
jgi:hypothetical protein